MNSSPHNVENQSGGIFIELALALSLLLVVSLGLGQQFMKVLHQIDHYRLATEITLGQQHDSIGFDPNSLSFSEVPDTGLGQLGFTSVDRVHYHEFIGQGITGRVPDSSYRVFLSLRYLNIAQTTGRIANLSTLAESIYDVPNLSPTGGCATLTNEIQTNLANFITLKTDLMQIFSDENAPSGPNDEDGRFGAKLFDFTYSGTRYREYETVFPLLFVAICSEVPTLLYPETVTTYHMLVPRRHVG